jgi:hypothetical protein
VAIAWVANGAIVTGTSPITPGLPASLATGNGVLTVLVAKPNTSSYTTPASWLLIGQDAGGAGAAGAAVGPTRCGVFFREKTAAWSAMSAHTITGVGIAATMASRWTNAAGKQWGLASRTAIYNSGAVGTALNVTPSAIDVMPGDWIVTAISNQTLAPTWSAHSYTASGITFGAITEFSDVIGTTTGNDVGGAMWGAQVTAGSGNVTIQNQATASANSTGALVMVRLREQDAPRYIQASNPALPRSYQR